MSAIALLDISSAELEHEHMLALAEQGRRDWAHLNPHRVQVSVAAP